MLCAVFSLCYVQFAVTTLVASLRACLASLGRADACMHILEAGQNQSWCADLFGRTFVKARNEILPYIYVYMFEYVYHVYMYILCIVYMAASHTLVTVNSVHVAWLLAVVLRVCGAQPWHDIPVFLPRSARLDMNT